MNTALTMSTRADGSSSDFIAVLDSWRGEWLERSNEMAVSQKDYKAATEVIEKIRIHLLNNIKTTINTKLLEI